MTPSTKKLNLGCGRDYRIGYINIDAMEGVGADLVLDITMPWPFADNSIKQIVAQDVLEHLTNEQQRFVLSEVHRVLLAEGELIVRIPNIDDIIARFSADPEVRNIFLYGDTSKTGVWGAHKSGHTLISFCRMAMCEGLEVVHYSNENTNVLFIFKKIQILSIEKITYINQTLGFGGAELFNSDLFSWLSKQKIKTNIYSTQNRFLKLLSTGSKTKIPIVVDIIGNWKGFIKGLLLLIPAAIYYFFTVWKNRDTQLILMSGFIEKILVTPWASLLRIPVIWIEFGPLESVLKKFFGLPKLLYLLVKDLPYAVVVPSNNTKNHIVPFAKISTSKIRVIPCAREIKPIRTPIKYDAVCVSRLEKGKGQDILIESWKRVTEIMPSARLAIVGEGEQMTNLTSLIRNLNLEKNIEMLGWVEDASLIIASSKIAVFPTTWSLEGFGLVAIEAMAQSKPVIGFAFGPLPEIIDEQVGQIINADIDLLADEIITLLKNPIRIEKMGITARKRYLERYTFSQVGPQYLSVFKEAIAQRRVYEILDTK